MSSLFSAAGSSFSSSPSSSGFLAVVAVAVAAAAAASSSAVVAAGAVAPPFASTFPSPITSMLRLRGLGLDLWSVLSGDARRVLSFAVGTRRGRAPGEERLK